MSSLGWKGMVSVLPVGCSSSQQTYEASANMITSASLRSDVHACSYFSIKLTNANLVEDVYIVILFSIHITATTLIENASICKFGWRSLYNPFQHSHHCNHIDWESKYPWNCNVGIQDKIIEQTKRVQLGAHGCSTRHSRPATARWGQDQQCSRPCSRRGWVDLARVPYHIRDSPWTPSNHQFPNLPAWSRSHTTSLRCQSAN